ncbi:NAD(P)H-hydrate epimerase (plasmid) [Halorientalis pallida]|uniref:NAD(P)H-hydrate epimerase n=1 Tax=Halorientalis pallida TaxID=2479928 RepID=UPI003C6F7DF7
MTKETIFETPTGEKVPAITAEQMREVDRIAVEEIGLGLLQMMENAGRNLAQQVRSTADDSVTVLAGSGGNGGGGLATARHLANRGVDVSVVLDREPANLDGAAATQLETVEAMDIPITVWSNETIRDSTTIVDALVGYGLSGPLRGTAAEIATAVSDESATVVSLDVPTGVNATTGDAPGPHITPDVTLTLALPKTGLTDTPGRLVLGDIGIPAVVYERAGIEYANPFDGYRIELRN